MTSLADLRPKTKNLVINLVAASGVDVSDWSNSRRGKVGASTNPKYCYEWAFVEPSAVVVLNLWFENLSDLDGEIVQRNNFKSDAQTLQKAGRQVQASRARRMDDALRTAGHDNLPIRVIINDGQQQPRGQPTAPKSTVRLRELDSEFWRILAYDQETGEHVLVRGRGAGCYVDQFSASGVGSDSPERRLETRCVVNRNPMVRERALRRSLGFCEYCGIPGFKRSDGSIYLETHHIVPLGEDGADRIKNVIALCPNHHREAHHGANAVAMRKIFSRKVEGSGD